MAIELIARAKVNLCLHVTGQRDNGYHLLDSLVVFAEIGDRLTFTPADNVELTIGGPFGDGLVGAQDNLVLQAARDFDTSQGCAIHLQKNLPVASGIGGGSADAAATLQGLATFWGMAIPNATAQLALGADVPVCVNGNTVRMQGVGEKITQITGIPNLPIVLINPGVSISTPEIFKLLSHKTNDPILVLPKGKLDNEQTVAWLKEQRNDLQLAAIKAAPVIVDVLRQLEQTGAALTRMSGSGATCFGIFPNQKAANTAALALIKQHPDWWIQATTLCGSDHAGHNKI